jgi:ribose transport system ATP-binding protein
MDEPTSSLSARDSEKLFAVIARLKAKQVSVIYISHFLDEVGRVSDRITVLRDGETVASGLPGTTSVTAIIKAMVGRPIAEIYPNSMRRPGTVILNVEDWKVRAKGASITVGVRRGQILGIAGLVGSGRSTFLRSLFGLHEAVSGQMTLEGKHAIKAGALSPKIAKANGMGFLSENRKEEGLAMSLSIRANVTLADLHTQTNVAGLIGLGAEAKSVARLCKQMNVQFHAVDQPVDTLSGGNQQKVALSRLLLGESEVWLLDEPTRGVDVAAKAEIYRLIATWAEQGKAVVWAGSYLPELFGICDSLAVMHRGELSSVRPVLEWTEASVMAWATQGANA